jgi:hypothetical protein
MPENSQPYHSESSRDTGSQNSSNQHKKTRAFKEGICRHAGAFRILCCCINQGCLKTGTAAQHSSHLVIGMMHAMLMVRAAAAAAAASMGHHF